MKRLWKSIIAVLLIVGLCVPAFAAEAGQTEGAADQTETTAEPWAKFTDVEEGRWSYDAIKFCYENNLFKGRSETTFDPTGKLTVAEAVALAGRLCYLTHGGEGDLPEVPDLTKPYARFYDENGKEIAVLDQEHQPECCNNRYIALSAVEDDPALPETCTLEVGLEGLFPVMTCQGIRKTYAYSGGHMSYGMRGTGYTFEDEEAIGNFYRIFSLVNPEYTTAESVNEWWYPADFYLRLYNNYSAVVDMCYHIALAHPDENGGISTDYDAVGTFPKEQATRAMFACLINGAVSEELGVINDISAVPDVDPETNRDAGAILRLYGAGIIVGVDNAGTFNGAGSLTREQAAVMLARVLKPELRKTI